MKTIPVIRKNGEDYQVEDSQARQDVSNLKSAMIVESDVSSVIVGLAWQGSSSLRFKSETGCSSCVFNCEQNQKYSISVSNNNRFAVFGKNTATDLSNVPSQVDTNAKLYQDNSKTYYEFNSGNYKSIYVYLSSSAQYVPTATIKKIENQIETNKRNIEKLSGNIENTNDNLGALFNTVLGSNDTKYSEKINTTAGTGIAATSKIIDVSIPAGSKYVIRISGDSTVLTASKINLYSWDSENNRTNIANNKNMNTDYFYYTASAISGFSMLIADANVLKTDTLTFDVVLLKSDNNKILSDDIVTGAYDNTAGTAFVNNDRIRTLNPIVCKAGTTVACDAYNINVYEYNILTGAFIVSNNGWTHNYTVQNDCYIFIIWQTGIANKTTAINNTFIYQTQRVVENTVLPINSIKSLAATNTKQFIQSETIISIAHRGNYTKCRGMMCGGSAVISAKRAGYMVSENDVALSSDGKFVMWHDTTLAAIGDSTHGVGDYTLAELKEMDFGSAYGSQYAGEKILTFAEWVLLCKQVGVECYIDFKVTGDSFTDAMAEEMTQTVRRYGMQDKVTYLENFAKIRQYQPNARISVLHVPDAEYIATFTPYLDGGRVAFNPNIIDLTSTYANNALDNGFELECWFADYSNNGFTTKTAVFDKIKDAVALGIQRITLDTYRIEDVFDAEYGLS